MLTAPGKFFESRRDQLIPAAAGIFLLISATLVYGPVIGLSAQPDTVGYGRHPAGQCAWHGSDPVFYQLPGDGTQHGEKDNLSSDFQHFCICIRDQPDGGLDSPSADSIRTMALGSHRDRAYEGMRLEMDGKHLDHYRYYNGHDDSVSIGFAAGAGVRNERLIYTISGVAESEDTI